MRKEFIVGSVAVIILTLVSVWLVASAGTSRQASISTQYTAADPATSKAKITYTDSGFQPMAVTVKSGDAITIENASTINLYFASGPHDKHDGDPELTIPTMGPGKSVTLKVTRVGMEPFHNHLRDDHTGTLTVTN